MKISWLKLLILGLFFSISAQAQLGPKEIKELAFLKGITSAYFYELNHEGKTSYLLGTYHWGVSLDEFPKHILNKIKKSQKLAVEIAPNSFQLDGMKKCHKKLNECILRMKNSAGFKVLRPNYQNALSPFVSRKYLSRTNALNYSNPAYLVWPDLALNGGMLDSEIVLYAAKINKKIISLENQKLRLEADKYVASLGQSLEFPPTTEDIAKRAHSENYDWFLDQAQLIQDYKTGNYSINADIFPGISFRNEAWMPRIMKLLESGEVFIAVGVSHLHGEAGLLNFLTKEGVQYEHYGF